MKVTARARKITALSRLIQGDASQVLALRPKLTLDLDQFSGDELEWIRVSFPPEENGQVMTVDVQKIEFHLGRSLSMIPQPSSYANFK